MAYASWSVVFGEQPSAAKWNILGSNDASFNDGSGLGDNTVTSEKLKATVSFSAHRTTNQTITTGTITTCQYDTESHDIGSDYNTGTYTFTAPYAGNYIFHHQVYMDSSIDTGVVFAFIYVNGTSRSQNAAYSSAATLDLSANCSLNINLAASDAVIARVLHNAGADRALLGGVEQVYFNGFLVGRV